jgi:hypothetical protein
VRRTSFRRAIAFAIVFCQLLAAMAFHVPMAHAMRAAASHHCHDGGTPEHSDDGGTCKSGPCKCPCAQLPALSVSVTPNISMVPHPPMALVYSVPAAPERPTKLFRPPI